MAWIHDQSFWICDPDPVMGPDHSKSPPTFARILAIIFLGIALKPVLDHIYWDVCLMSQVSNKYAPDEQNQYYPKRPASSSLQTHFSLYWLGTIHFDSVNNAYWVSLKQLHMKSPQHELPESSLLCDT